VGGGGARLGLRSSKSEASLVVGGWQSKRSVDGRSAAKSIGGWWLAVGGGVEK